MVINLTDSLYTLVIYTLYIYLKPRYLQKSWCEMLYLEYQLICKKTSVMWNKPRVSVFFEYDRDFL